MQELQKSASLYCRVHDIDLWNHIEMIALPPRSEPNGGMRRRIKSGFIAYRLSGTRRVGGITLLFRNR
jgi:hypothetical protein